MRVYPPLRAREESGARLYARSRNRSGGGGGIGK
jgi:hypothetical protein